MFSGLDYIGPTGLVRQLQRRAARRFCRACRLDWTSTPCEILLERRPRVPHLLQCAARRLQAACENESTDIALKLVDFESF